MEEEIIKGLQENQEQAIRLLRENINLKKEIKELKERLSKASQLVRSRTYSIYTKKTKETKTDIAGKKLEELMNLLENKKRG